MSWTSWVIWTSLVVGVAIIVWGMFDVMSFSREEFERAGRSRASWLLLPIVVGPLATGLWWATARHDVIDPSRVDDPDLPPPDRPFGVAKRA